MLLILPSATTASLITVLRRISRFEGTWAMIAWIMAAGVKVVVLTLAIPPAGRLATMSLKTRGQFAFAVWKGSQPGTLGQSTAHTAEEVSCPPIQSVGSVRTTCSPGSAFAAAIPAAIAAVLPPTMTTSQRMEGIALRTMGPTVWTGDGATDGAEDGVGVGGTIIRSLRRRRARRRARLSPGRSPSRGGGARCGHRAAFHAASNTWGMRWKATCPAVTAESPPSLPAKASATRRSICPRSTPAGTSKPITSTKGPRLVTSSDESCSGAIGTQPASPSRRSTGLSGFQPCRA